MIICEAMMALCELHEALGLPPANTFEGCCEYRVDDHWRLALNAHQEPRKDSTGAEVPPCNCYAEFNGWPAALFTPAGGVVAHGTIANEAELIAALRTAAAIARQHNVMQDAAGKEAP